MSDIFLVKLQYKISTINSNLSNKLNKNDFNSNYWIPINGYNLSNEKGWFAYSTNSNLLPSLGIPSGFSPYGTIFGSYKVSYKLIIYVDVFGNFAVYSTNLNKWVPYKISE